MIRVGKKLFKIWRIELESSRSKEQFLKKAKKVSDYGKHQVLSSKLAYSETTRIKNKKSMKEDNTELELREKNDKTIESEFARKKMISNISDSKLNTSYINNTEGEILRKKIKNQTDQNISCNTKFNNLKCSKNKSMMEMNNLEDDTGRKQENFNGCNIKVKSCEEEQNNSFVQVQVKKVGEGSQKESKQNLNEGSRPVPQPEKEKEVKDWLKLSLEENNIQVSGSEIDLEGIYSAEHNEFIKVMVGLFSLTW